jgi:hypothetical protein
MYQVAATETSGDTASVVNAIIAILIVEIVDI